MLSAEEEKKIQLIESSSYPEILKKHYDLILEAILNHGRQEVKKIVAEVKDEYPELVESRLESWLVTFWRRLKEFPDSLKILNKIESSEHELLISSQSLDYIRNNVVSQDVAKWKDSKIPAELYSNGEFIKKTQKKKIGDFGQEHDKIILCLGCQNFEDFGQVVKLISKHKDFENDFYIQCMTQDQIKDRFLLLCLYIGQIAGNLKKSSVSLSKEVKPYDLIQRTYLSKGDILKKQQSPSTPLKKGSVKKVQGNFSPLRLNSDRMMIERHDADSFEDLGSLSNNMESRTRSSRTTKSVSRLRHTAD